MTNALIVRSNNEEALLAASTNTRSHSATELRHRLRLQRKPAAKLKAKSSTQVVERTGPIDKASLGIGPILPRLRLTLVRRMTLDSRYRQPGGRLEAAKYLISGVGLGCWTLSRAFPYPATTVSTF